MKNNNSIKPCRYYLKGRHCKNVDFPCGELLMNGKERKCTSLLYYSMELENKVKRLEWYLKQIRIEELNQLDIDFDEYITNCSSTEYNNIINLVEEALEERPEEDCRYINNDNN